MERSGKKGFKDLKTVDQQNSGSLNFRIIGIGASAGGLEALSLFFENTPKNTGFAFVVIQHLDPNYAGMLTELLQRTTEMKVIQVTDKLHVLPNHIYVIPPNKSMSILKGYLHLFKPIETRGLRLPIDLFFKSLAEDQEENGIGIILSGMGSDGSIGIKAIKKKKGIICVQDPVTAKFESMPQNALKAVKVDVMATASELPIKLIEFIKHKPKIPETTIIEAENIIDIDKIIILLREQTGHDFSLYKKNTLYRRIERRMNVHVIDSISKYVRFSQKNPYELDILFKELLIGVTGFFRDAPVWEKLKEVVFPNLFKSLPNKYTLRAWVAGCSTGEEAYSLAIIFQEVYETYKNKKNITLQIFATDLDKEAIDIARKGIYNQSILEHVSEDRINNFFLRDDDKLKVNSTIREMVVFASHNVIKEPPFTKLDFLFCRNLLIYIEPVLQKKLMNLFHYCLKINGIMVLGTSESENSQKNIFEPIDSKLKIYKSLDQDLGKKLLNFPSSFTYIKNQQLKPITKVKSKENIQNIADQIMLKYFAPSSVLVNSEGDILYVTGSTGKYLEPAVGKANWNIYAMAKEGLSEILPSAISKVKNNYEIFTLDNVKVGAKNNLHSVKVTLQQIEKPLTIKGCIMIAFSDVSDTTKILKHSRSKLNTREKELEHELQRANEHIQSTLEEMQSTQEELKSANEELQSTNEELQSTNEELTTSKEEMQSLNEELQTVNVELENKMVDYMESNNDMKNLLNSTDIATLFLDKELNIRRYTEQLTNLFKLRQTDVGRPFTDLVSELVYPEIKQHITEVLRTLIFKETKVSTKNNKWFKVRIMPYRTIDDRIDGLVITFIDINESKILEEKLNETINKLREHKLL